MAKRSTSAVLDDLLEILRGSDEPLSTREIALRRRLDWATVEKYLSHIHEFSRAGCLIRIDKAHTTLWKLERKSMEIPLTEKRGTFKIRIGRETTKRADEWAKKLNGVEPRKKLEILTRLSDSFIGLHKNRIDKIRGLKECRLRLLHIE